MVEVHGEVGAGFESVKKLFTENMSTLAEENAQLCVYVGNDKVVDLWASANGDDAFNADSLVNIFSSGKSLEALALALLADQGLIDYNARVAEYWPEFSGGGKAGTTIADVMRHEAGLANFNQSIAPEDLHRENLKANKLGALIANHPASFVDETSPREYHALTRGWIVNEIVRRVHPEGKTIGEFLQQAVFEPMAVDVRIGLSSEDMARVSSVQLLPLLKHMRHTFRPAPLGRRVKHNVFDLSRNLMPLIARARKSGASDRPPVFNDIRSINDLIALFNSPVLRQGETPSANAHASARGLAKLGAMLASKGHWDNTDYLATETWSQMHAEPISRHMLMTTHFSQGGINHYQMPNIASHQDRSGNHGREGFWGWMGLGGSVFQWHPEHQIGFGFVPTSLHALDFLNERGKDYQAAVLKCVGARTW